MKTDPSVILNFAVCLVVASFGTIILAYLLKNQEVKHKESQDIDDRFMFRAFICWIISWWVWVFLWGLVMVLGTKETWNKIAVLVLSDCNTVLIVLFYFGITRARDYELAQYVTNGAQLFAGVVVAWVCLYALGEGIDGGYNLHDKWSQALSLFSSVLVGWAFKLRYGTIWVLITGLAYAIAQPPAYEALTGHIFSPAKAEVVLVSLAILKVIWATTTAYYAGFKPLTTESLVKPLPRYIDERRYFKLSDQSLSKLRAEVPDTIIKQLEGLKNNDPLKKGDFLKTLTTKIGHRQSKSYRSAILKCADQRPSRTWKELIFMQLAIGSLVIVIVARSYRNSFLQSEVPFIVAVALALVALISGVATLSQKAKKWFNDSSNN